MPAKHTPGPWTGKTHAGQLFELTGPDGGPVLRIRGGMTPTTADSRLLLAAPALLAALKLVIDCPCMNEDGNDAADARAYAAALAAIAAAEGDSPAGG